MAFRACILLHISVCHTRRPGLGELITCKWKGWDLHSHLTTSPGLPSFTLHEAPQGRWRGSQKDGWGLELSREYPRVPGAFLCALWRGAAFLACATLCHQDDLPCTAPLCCTTLPAVSAPFQLTQRGLSRNQEASCPPPYICSQCHLALLSPGRTGPG